MQDSARQDTLFSSLSFDRLPISFVSRIYPVTILMIVYPAISRPIEGLMSLSFWMGCWENIGHDELGRMDIPGWGSACGFSSVARLRADERRRLSVIHRRYKAAPLREIGVIVSRPARIVGILLSSLTPPSNRDTPASRD